MKLGFLKKCRMRATVLALSTALAISWFVHPAIALAEEHEEEEDHSYRPKEYDRDEVCNFVYARIYEVENYIEDKVENLVYDESISFVHVFKYEDDFISANYIVAKFSELRTVFSPKFIINGNYLKFANKYQLLQRLKINADLEFEDISVNCDGMDVKFKFDKEKLVEACIVMDLDIDLDIDLECI